MDEGDIGSPARPVSSVLQVPGAGGGIVVSKQDPHGDLPAAFFLQNVLQLPTPVEMSNTPR